MVRVHHLKFKLLVNSRGSIYMYWEKWHHIKIESLLKLSCNFLKILQQFKRSILPGWLIPVSTSYQQASKFMNFYWSYDRPHAHDVISVGRPHVEVKRRLCVQICAFRLFHHRFSSKMAAGWRQCIRPIDACVVLSSNFFFCFCLD